MQCFWFESWAGKAEVPALHYALMGVNRESLQSAQVLSKEILITKETKNPCCVKSASALRIKLLCILEIVNLWQDEAREERIGKATCLRRPEPLWQA